MKVFVFFASVIGMIGTGAAFIALSVKAQFLPAVLVPIFVFCLLVAVALDKDVN